MRMLRLFPIALCLLGLSMVAAPARADDKPARESAELELRTTRVVIFKDGYSLFVREGTATADSQGRVHTYEVPDAAVLGCFWAYAQDRKLAGMRAQTVTDVSKRTEEATCLSILELLRANKGAQVTLGLGGDKELTGFIDRVLDRPAPAAVSGPAPLSNRLRGRMPVPSPVASVEREVQPIGGALVVVRGTPRGEVVLPVSQVQTISTVDLITKMTRTFERTRTRKRLQFELGAGRAGKPTTVTMIYFAPGLRWIPTYRVSGGLDTSADLALQAELLNEVMDLEDVAADLVVGVPHFKFREVVSPLTLEAQLHRALNQAAPQIMGQQLSNAYFGARGSEVVDPRASIEMAPELAAGGSHDLFVYSLPKLSLPKGARATMPLWQNKVPLRHLYTLDIELGRDPKSGRTYTREQQGRNAQRQPARTSPLELSENAVWHQFELTNDSDVPWTTGAALSMKDLLPLGQDMLTYTSPGAKALLPLTVAVDVQAKYDESELERKNNALTLNRHSYTRITKRARVRLHNYRSKSVTMRIKLSLGGKVVKGSNEANVTINDFRASDWTNSNYNVELNNHSDVEWSVVLQPGASMELTAEYEFYIG